MKSFALIIIVWLVVIYAIVSLEEHRAQNGGVPLVKSSAAQGDMAKQNTWLAPCPADLRNVPKFVENKA